MFLRKQYILNIATLDISPIEGTKLYRPSMEHELLEKMNISSTNRLGHLGFIPDYTPRVRYLTLNPTDKNLSEIEELNIACGTEFLFASDEFIPGKHLRAIGRTKAIFPDDKRIFEQGIIYFKCNDVELISRGHRLISAQQKNSIEEIVKKYRKPLAYVEFLNFDHMAEEPSKNQLNPKWSNGAKDRAIAHAVAAHGHILAAREMEVARVLNGKPGM